MNGGIKPVKPTELTYQKALWVPPLLLVKSSLSYTNPISLLVFDTTSSAQCYTHSWMTHLFPLLSQCSNTGEATVLHWCCGGHFNFSYYFYFLTISYIYAHRGLWMNLSHFHPPPVIFSSPLFSQTFCFTQSSFVCVLLSTVSVTCLSVDGTSKWIKNYCSGYTTE